MKSIDKQSVGAEQVLTRNIRVYIVTWSSHWIVNYSRHLLAAQNATKKIRSPVSFPETSRNLFDNIAASPEE